jgi:Polyketide cyclase / dehydrase and lipid transport
MRILVCPVAIIEAPVEIVLRLLELRNFGTWVDAKVEKVNPPGPMVVGQEATFSAKRFLLTRKGKIKVVAIDTANRTIRYDVFGPFGFKNEEKLEYRPLTDTTCEVQYNCNFIFADGIKGFLIKTLLGRRLISGPTDSLRRLKAKAESEYKQS